MKRLDKATLPQSDTIKKNNMFTFANPHDCRKKGSKVEILKQNTMLLTQFFLKGCLFNHVQTRIWQNSSNSRTRESLLFIRAPKFAEELETSRTSSHASTHQLAAPNQQDKQQFTCSTWLPSSIWCILPEQQYLLSMYPYTLCLS